MLFFLFLLLIIASVFVTIKSYNSLQALAQNVREKASNVQVSISKKLSLINQMIDVVKNYQEGEQFVQLKISQDTNANNLMSTYQQSGNVLSTLQGMAERFPNLKANEQYNNLSHSIATCEVDVQNKRVAYNESVKDYNVVRLKIPTVFIARFIGFSEAPYLQFDTSGITDVTTLKDFKTDDGERLNQLLSDAGKQISGAGKTIVTHAGQAGKYIGEKIKERKGEDNRTDH
ncbi:MAG TPA: LemA family protein [Flavipsychrobacter sp.]|nr:LemA family protein [Flavipsychrobacter sp.]